MALSMLNVNKPLGLIMVPSSYILRLAWSLFHIGYICLCQLHKKHKSTTQRIGTCIQETIYTEHVCRSRRLIELTFIHRFIFIQAKKVGFDKRSMWKGCSLFWRRSLHNSSQRFAQHTHHESMDKIRNIGIIAHIDAGKTTTTERMLFYSGFTKCLGDVDDGNTVMDYMEQERDRGITVTSAAITFEWRGHKINLIDTPGHVDFTVEVERALRVLDGAITILDASAGVEAQTLTVWRQADRYHIPRIVFLNKMDKPGASFRLCLHSLEEKFHIKPLVLNVPIFINDRFAGVHDLVHMETLIWNDSKSSDGFSFERSSIADKDCEEVLKLRSDLIGKLADCDEHIADLVLCDTEIKDFSPSDLIPAIRRAMIQQKVVPVLCGSSLKNKGVQPLIDAITYYLPSPKDISYGFADYYGSDLCALAFKVIHDKQRGPLTFVRIYSGMLKSGSSIYNINRTTSEKTSRLLQVYADDLHDLSHAVAGNIIAIAGLRQTYTGDTITSRHSVAKEAAQMYKRKMRISLPETETHETEDEAWEDDELDEERDTLTEDMIPILAGLKVPDPVFFCSIEPSSIMAQKALDAALENLQKEDPSLKVDVNTDTGQTVLSGMGELHLDIIKSRLEKEYKLDVDLGPLQIAYRETIEQSAEVTEVLDKNLSGKQQFVHMKLSIHPDQDNREFKHVLLQKSADHPLHIKPRFIKAIENGIKSGLSSGSLLNFPVIHTTVHIHEFSKNYHATLPMITACAAMAVQKALKQTDALLLEPMMAVEVSVEEGRCGDVVTDLSQRRSHILNIKARQTTKIVDALTPLQELMGYSTDLRTITSGTATCTLSLSHYEKVSSDEVERVIERISGFHSPNLF